MPAFLFSCTCGALLFRLESATGFGGTNMLSRVVLLVFGLLFASQAFADDNRPFPPPLICHTQTALMRMFALQDVFDAPAEINTLMANVIDGKLPQVRQQLKTMPTADAMKWRQSAMIIAAYANNSAVVNGLLDDGAVVDGSGWMRGLKRSFHDQALADIKKDPNWERHPNFNEVAILWLPVKGGLDGAALGIAARCNDVATLDVLLAHHADMDANASPTVMSPLEAAIAIGNTAIVQRLLDQGADVCAEDRRIQRRQAGRKINHFFTLADLGRREKLPDHMVSQLTCPVLDADH